MSRPTQDPWQTLRQFTQARIAQGHVGCGTPTKALLDFQLAHAAARDAVHQPWDVEQFAQSVQDFGLETLCLTTPITNRQQYLLRPDLGRQLSENSQQLLKTRSIKPCDVVLIITNGLSSKALDAHGLPLLETLLAAFKTSTIQLGPICLIPDGRVALSDQIGALTAARLVIMIVGERPGLSAADSLGIYLTHSPRLENTDADRNCISNVRPPEGLSYKEAAAKTLYLSQKALQCGFTGVALKDEMPAYLLD
jgi:ethanolamine ammonia-lyase small subunit